MMNTDAVLTVYSTPLKTKILLTWKWSAFDFTGCNFEILKIFERVLLSKTNIPPMEIRNNTYGNQNDSKRRKMIRNIIKS